MQMMLSLACTQLRMTPAETIVAATINPAYSLRRHQRTGSLEPGKIADIAVFDVGDYREIPYYFGVNTCWMTFKRGEIVHSRKTALSSRIHQAQDRLYATRRSLRSCLRVVLKFRPTAGHQAAASPGTAMITPG